MGNLTTQLRHLATATLSGLFLATSGSFAEDAGNLYNTNFDINAGLRYFERQCSRCHGFDAKGNDETGAPDLTGRLAVPAPMSVYTTSSAPAFLEPPCSLSQQTCLTPKFGS